MLGGVLHSSSLDQVSFGLGAGLNGGPRQRGGVHVTLVARLAKRRRALSLLHAEDEWPGREGCVAGGDGVNVAGKLVLGAQLVQIADALVLAVLASPRSVSVLLGVAKRNL